MELSCGWVFMKEQEKNSFPNDIQAYAYCLYRQKIKIGLRARKYKILVRESVFLGATYIFSTEYCQTHTVMSV